MECEVAQAHLADHLARTLPRAVAADVAAHLRACETCAAEYEAMGETWQLLRTIPAAEPDSASMRTRFETGLRDYMLEHQPRKSERRGLWYYGLQFAAVQIGVDQVGGLQCDAATSQRRAHQRGGLVGAEGAGHAHAGDLVTAGSGFHSSLRSNMPFNPVLSITARPTALGS